MELNILRRKVSRNVSITYNIFDCVHWLPPYLFQLIPRESHSCNTHNSEDIPTCHCRTNSFKNSFFPWTICEWNKLDLDILKSTYSLFRQHLLLQHLL